MEALSPFHLIIILAVIVLLFSISPPLIVPNPLIAPRFAIPP